MENLNKIPIPTDAVGGDNQINNTTESNFVSVYFKNLEQEICNHIGKADYIFGCVAWLTNKNILKSLSKKNCSIIIQKEDFLRPDFNQIKSNKNEIYNLYKSLKCNIGRFAFKNLISELSVCTDPAIDPVRVMGLSNSNRKFTLPRMHNKFIVFGRNVAKEPYQDETFIDNIYLYGVWTGSFNFTQNATLSFENAVYIEDQKITQAYFKEFGQIMALSEKLDWESEYISPEWRVGT